MRKKSYSPSPIFKTLTSPTSVGESPDKYQAFKWGGVELGDLTPYFKKLKL